MKMEFQKKEIVNTHKLRGGEVIYFKDENIYYLVGKEVGMHREGYFNLIDFKTGVVYGLSNWQKSLDNGECYIVDSKVVISEL